MKEDLENSLFAVTSRVLDDIVMLARDKARALGKEIQKTDHEELAKLLKIPNKDLHRLLVTPSGLTFRQLNKMADAVGLDVTVVVQRKVQGY